MQVLTRSYFLAKKNEMTVQISLSYLDSHVTRCLRGCVNLHDLKSLTDQCGTTVEIESRDRLLIYHFPAGGEFSHLTS